ncbi:MAG: EF-P lysine aminoacylase EpmA, partial [Pirellulales bacterium]|nr:EF-P lysine aminoacylase EpmA [Pirellulales bacterium]
MFRLPREDFRPTADWTALRERAGLLRRLRLFFDQRGFLEVETPLLSADTVVDRHLDPFSIEVHTPGGARTYWLQTSPELAMKRLLAGGAEAIYQVTRAFRQEELGPLHNPEFTLVEWYRAGDEMAAGMAFLDQLCQAMLGRGSAQQLSYRCAFERYAGLDPLTAPLDALRSAARRTSAPPASFRPDDRDLWLDWILTEQVQPHLGRTRPAILYDYPASQAALARVRDESPPVAERFELFVEGIELANGYHELLDPDLLRRRNAANNAARAADGKHPLPVDSRLLDAMESGLPQATGVALGFDRLVML